MRVKFKEAVEQFEKQYLTLKLYEYKSNVSKMSEGIGLDRAHLHRKMKQYGIKTCAFRIQKSITTSSNREE